MKQHLSLIAAGLLFGASTVAGAASSIPSQAPDVPGNAGGGPVDCKQTPTDRNCVSMNPKNDSNSKASRTTRSDPDKDRVTYGSSSDSAGGSASGTPKQANETQGPSGRKNDRVQ
jgi:hypothetical protein